MNTPGKASLPVIKRLPKYYRYLRTLKNDGITSISSRELAAQMGTTASQVRQDFNCIGDVNGRQGIGYSVENLLSILEHLLFGNGDLLPTILIGCGRLGKAVSRFITTDTNGYKLIAAFDNAPDEVGKEINGIRILHIDELEAFCAEHHPEVAVLCLPRSGAEEIDYSKDLPAGTLQLLDLMEKMLHEDDLRIFPEDLYAQGHVLHSPEAVVYSPKELMEMDWLDECVEGALPHYDELDVKTHTLMAINGLNTLKGFVK